MKIVYSYKTKSGHLQDALLQHVTYIILNFYD